MRDVFLSELLRCLNELFLSTVRPNYELDLGADIEQPFDCLIVQNRKAVLSMRRSMGWTSEHVHCSPSTRTLQQPARAIRTNHIANYCMVGVCLGINGRKFGRRSSSCLIAYMYETRVTLLVMRWTLCISGFLKRDPAPMGVRRKFSRWG